MAMALSVRMRTAKTWRRAARGCLVAALGVWVSSAQAQDPRLRAGVTIRFGTDTTSTLHVAQLEQATRDSLLLRRCETCSRTGYSFSEVNRLAAFQRIPAGMRMVSGFGWGGLLGLGLGAIAATTCHGTADRCEDAFLLVPFTGLLGGFVGALTGYLTAYRWEPVATGRF